MPPEEADQVTSAASAALTSALLVAFGSSVPSSLRLVLGIPLTLAGFVAIVVAAARARRAPGRGSTRAAFAGLAAVAALGIVVSPPDQGAAWYSTLCRGAALVSIAIVGLVDAGSERWRRRGVWTTIALVTSLEILAPIALPSPVIDVWAWTQASVRGMLHGVHPYTIQIPDVYGGAFDYGYRTTVLPYTPFTVLAGAPWVALAGDYRFGLACCFPVTMALFRAAGRRFAVEARTLDMLTLAMALHPRNVQLVAFGWNEPLLGVALAAFLYFAARSPAGLGAPTAFFLLPAIKQYAAVLPIVYAAMRPRWRPIVFAVAAAAITVAPFAVWNWRATLDGLLFQVRAPIPFRPDSVSATALTYAVAGITPPRWLSPVAQFVSGGLAAAWLWRAGLPGLLLASAFAIFTSLLVGMQAFMNYYWFVVFLLIASALVLEARRPIAW